MADVVIAGGGPAGRALARACARRGLATVLIDPAPGRRWRATYGLWADELPSLPESAVACAPSSALAFGTAPHVLDRQYLVVDNAGLRTWLDGGHDVVAGTVSAVDHGGQGTSVRLEDGRVLAAGLYVDASGARPRGDRYEQTAFGAVLPAEDALRLVDEPDTAVFMDWRGTESGFLYVLPLGDGTVLVEETSLARKPGLPLELLAARLRARLKAAGLASRGREERVRIVLDVPVPRRGRTVPFGAAAGLVHPATGYSLATSVRLAEPVADSIALAWDRGPAAAASAAHGALWPSSARTVHGLRRHGLRALCGMPPELVPVFFDHFFTLPVPLQRAFTSGREDVSGTTEAMSALFRLAPWKVRKHLIGWPGLRRSR
ncbi:lycopene cyclase family protein [Amycolatopsis azurea]|uniref:Lycopene cyclase n=1 Tax=Amycolatopsis azurea DSM 43854 TaxID=1238180 RepID=M2P1J4_9PSEU|nr:lycopene cyclase family protein [Amycolatopsis azurea]EMD28929.1 lycopene cyclase family protein [Amycolatopsis azurea DSM 43854]OOC04646.1 lycopene cyclase [Amycolatopsis azurea DSM 43854]